MRLSHIFSKKARDAHRRARAFDEDLDDATTALHSDELLAIRASIAQFKNGIGREIGKDPALFQSRMEWIWRPPHIPRDPGVLYQIYVPNPEREDSRKNLPWSISLSNEFVKETTSIDRKLQGRILESLMQIAARPLEARGDTQKPLTANLNGLWRVRLGDYRLIYRPDLRDRRVYCLSFSARGDAYA